MKKLLVVTISATMILCWIALAASAQNPPAEKTSTLWVLECSKGWNPLLWRMTVKENPFLEESGRVQWDKNHPIVMVKSGEEFRGLDKLEITARKLPYKELVLIHQTSTTSPTKSHCRWLHVGIAFALYVIVLFFLSILVKPRKNSYGPAVCKTRR